jgi:threonine dehydratase
MNSTTINIKSVYKAQKNLIGIINKTPLELNERLSNKYEANIYLKREDLQPVRSYKIRGAYNKISILPIDKRKNGIVAASAGNHAQGVALACKKLEIKGVIFMPVTTPSQKIVQVQMHGNSFVEVKLFGDTFDEAFKASMEYCEQHKMEFVHPFDDLDIIAGQATIALEIISDIKDNVDIVFAPLGGGGLVSGLSSVFKSISTNTKIIAVEPENAESMKKAIDNGSPITLPEIDTFVDGAAVKRVGNFTFDICSKLVTEYTNVPVGKICTNILELYNRDGIITEPAGVLSVSALDSYKEEIKGKTIVCVISGGNNDITRMEDIKERSLMYEGLKHYFVVTFPQRAGALKEFVLYVLGENDDITFFEYSKKTSRSTGPAVVGIQLKKKEDFEPLVNRMKEKGFLGEYLNHKPEFFGVLI